MRTTTKDAPIARFSPPFVTQMDKQSRYPKSSAPRHGEQESRLRAVIASGADMNVVTDEAGRTPLHVAAGAGDAPCVRLLLLEANVDVNARETNARTATFVAARQGQAESLRMLIAASANVNLPNQQGMSPLFAVCESGHAHCVRMLCEAHADVDQAPSLRC